MSHIIVRKIVGEKTKFAGHDWWYQFRSLDTFFEEDAIEKYVQLLYRQYSEITKKWDDNANSEWICRNYMALKMILSSSVMLQSLEYAEDNNLRIVESYLEYYSLLSSIRSMVFTSPLQAWKNGGIIKLEHNKTINIAVDIITKLNKERGLAIKRHLKSLKAFRELISYRAPSNGDLAHKPVLEMDRIYLCQAFVEIAQLQSEILEMSLNKNINKEYSFKDEYIYQLCNTEIENEIFFDKEDAYRLGYYQRKYPLPSNICHMMSEGHVEDFFGSWCARNGEKDGFDPDNDWGIIFDVP